jgi:hypothetical protein
MLHSAHVSSRSRRLLRNILIAVPVLFVLIFIAAEIILSTDLPRNLVISAVEKQLGLRITANSLSTGVFGHTTLEDVTVTLPLADKAFLAIPVLKLNHTWLPGILFGFFTIHDISIDHPRLEVLQEPNGSWNLQEVAQLLARTGGGGNSAQQSNQPNQPNEIPLLPALDVSDAQIVVTDNQRRSTTLEHLQITGRSDGPLVWQYTAAIPGQLDLNGKLAPGGPWAHRLDIQIKNARSWLTPWISSWPSSAQLQARWDGRIDSGNLLGRFEILHSNFNSLSITGPFEVASGESNATVSPVGVLVSNDPSHSLDTRIASGDIVFSAGGIEFQNLGLECARGRASLDAKYTFADGSASLHAVWRDMAMPSAVTQSGDLQLDYTSPLGQPRFTATLQNQGTARFGKWDAQLSLNGAGDNLTDLSLSLYAQKLSFESNSGKSLNFSGLTADLSGYPGGLLLRDLRIGHAHPLNGQGGYSIADRTSWLSFDGHGVPLPLPGEPVNTLAVDLNLWTNPKRIHLQQFYLNTGMFSAYANGDYVYNIPKPLKAHAYLTENPTFASPDAAPQPFRGLLQSTIDLNGTIAPLDLVLTGSARGNDVYIGQRPLGDVNLNLAGYFRDDLVYISSQDVQVLGGTWNVSGYWPASDSLFHIDNLSVEHLSLPLAADTDNIAGTLDGKCSIDVHDLTPDGIAVDGSFDIHNLVLGNPQRTAAAKYLTFDEVQVSSARLEYGTIDIKPISVVRKIGPTTGQANLSLYTTLEHPRNLTIGIDAHSWPVQATTSSSPTTFPSPGTPGEGQGEGSCLLSATGSVDLDLAAISAFGHLNLQADTSWDSQSIGQLKASVNLDRRSADIDDIEIKTLDGNAAGSAFFNLDKPFTTRLNLGWKNLDLAALKPIAPRLSSISGKADGFLQVQPATTPRPLGPLAIDLQFHSRGIRFQNFNIGDLQTHAFLGPDRVVLDDSPNRPSQIAVAGGTIRFWGRVARHDADVYQSLAQFNLQNLQLDSLLPAGAKNARTPGLLSGQITILGRPRHFDLATGQGTLTLTQSDLAGTGAISLVYDLMHLSHNAKKPTGSGQIDFTIQNRNATITAMHYFDKGSEIRLSGDIVDLPSLPHSPINLIVVGSARPLASIGIPGFADFDAALGTIQHDAFTVQVTGYLDHPKQKPIPFADIGQEMKNLLFGDVHAATE